MNTARAITTSIHSSTALAWDDFCGSWKKGVWSFRIQRTSFLIAQATLSSSDGLDNASERAGHNCINSFYFIARGAIIPVADDNLDRDVKSYRQGVHKRGGEGIRVAAIHDQWQVVVWGS
ncbi:hypothetical protein [Rhizobium mongolense]|uniref:Uncharacterized protein n=1 Tax=Rhizobium mongolense TaxID=57676 RepID=A0ABR6ILV0_9HYPH|nr:hypothetical protein [Rhizobium mongolense]MBB4228775.1 hypothetical protein [Rhizobium mongolense]